MNPSIQQVGGKSLADAAQFRRVADSIRAVIRLWLVVASAPRKTFPEDEKITDFAV